MDWIQFLSIAIFNILAILILYALHRTYKKILKNITFDDNVLKEESQSADQYEIAYLIDQDWEVLRLAFYNLVKKNYLVEINPPLEPLKDKYGFPPKKYVLNKEADLNVLHPIEKTVAMLYDKCASLPAHQIFNEIKNSVKKINYLLIRPAQLSWYGCISIAGVTLVAMFNLIFLSVEVSLVVQRMHRVNHSNWLYYVISIILFGLFILGIIKAQKTSKELAKRCELNVQKYKEFFEKAHFPYPNLKEGSLAEYLNEIIWED